MTKSNREYNISELKSLLRKSIPEDILVCINPYDDFIIIYIEDYSIDVFGYDLNEYSQVWQIVRYVLTKVIEHYNGTAVGGPKEEPSKALADLSNLCYNKFSR